LSPFGSAIKAVAFKPSENDKTLPPTLLIAARLCDLPEKQGTDTRNSEVFDPSASNDKNTAHSSLHGSRARVPQAS
jgi:hypothetical protein